MLLALKGFNKTSFSLLKEFIQMVVCLGKFCQDKCQVVFNDSASFETVSLKLFLSHYYYFQEFSQSF